MNTTQYLPPPSPLPLSPMSGPPASRSPGASSPSSPPQSLSPTLMQPTPTSSTTPAPSVRPSLLQRMTSKSRKAEQSGRAKEITLVAFRVLQTITKLAKDASSDAGIPGLAPGLAVVSQILDKALKMNQTIEGIDALQSRLQELVVMLQSFRSRPDGSAVSDSTSSRLQRLNEKWTEVGKKLERLRSRGRFKKFIRSDIDSEDLVQLIAEINASLQEFLFGGALYVEQSIHRIREGVENVQKNTEATQVHIQKVHDEVDVVRTGVESLGADLGVVQTTVGVVQTNVEVVREAVEGTSMGMQLVRTEVAGVGTEVGQVGVAVESVDSRVQTVQSEVQNAKEEIHQLRGDVQGVRADVEGVGKRVDNLQDDHLLPRFAKRAQYDANEVRKPCLSGTRVTVLDRLRNWVTIACTQRQALLEPNPGNIFWINGLAGTGKTSIACSVAMWCKEKNLLAANVFCARDDTECSDPSLIFPTISRQMCHFHPGFKEKVLEVMKKDPDVVYAGASRQFEALILQPLEALQGSFPTSVIVIDALDECHDTNATSTILSVIAKYISRIAGILLFIVTSRPEPRITALFERRRGESLRDVTIPLLLHMIELDAVSNDIQRYLAHGFNEIADMFAVEEGWPSAQHVKRLTELSCGLFIWAATAIRFIEDEAYNDPQGQLEALLNTQSSSQSRDNILSSLYIQIAKAATQKISPSLTGRLRLILGTIALAQEPLSTSALADLLELPQTAIRNSLTGLRSVLYIPEDSDEVIRVIHPTFPEFLLDTDSSKPDAFRIEPVERHTALCTRSFEVMRALKYDIAGIQNPALLKGEVSDLDEKIRRYIPHSLRYVCRHWSIHFAKCSANLALAEAVSAALQDFLHHRMLHWLEACSLLGDLEGTVAGLITCRSVCRTLGERFAHLEPLLADARRFVSTYFACIEGAPLQVYHSALASAPTESSVRRTYAQQLGPSPVIRHGQTPDWTPSIDTLPISNTHAVAFSPDGAHFVTGGGKPCCTLMFWQASTRNLVGTIEKPDISSVTAVAYFPDGTRLVFATADCQVFTLEVETGEVVQTLKDISGDVVSLACLSGGRNIMTADFYGNLILRDLYAPEDRCRALFRDRDDWSIYQIADIARLSRPDVHPERCWMTFQVATSSDGTTIAYCRGPSLCLYNVTTEKRESFVLPETCMATALSANGLYVAVSGWQSIRVYTLGGKSLVYQWKLEERWASIERIALSGDGRYVGCGLSEGTVIWADVLGSDEGLRCFHGHFGKVTDIVWSPDDSQLITTARQSFSVRIWDPIRHFPKPFASTKNSHKTPRCFLTIRANAVCLCRLPIVVDRKQLHFLNHSIAPRTPGCDRALVLCADIAEAALELASDSLACDFDPSWEMITGKKHVAYGTQAVAISDDGTLLAFEKGLGRGVIHICNLENAEIVTTLSVRSNGSMVNARTMAFSPDRTLLALSSCSSIPVQVWHIPTARLVSSYSDHELDSVEDIAFSSDCRFVISGSDDGTVCVFNLEVKRVVHVLEHEDGVEHVMFSTDDRHILSQAGFDLYVWDASTGALLCRLECMHGAWVRSVDFSPDGTGICLRLNSSKILKLSLWKPGDRDWPAYHVTLYGWIYAKSPGRMLRLGWLPLGWRNIIAWDDKTLCVVEDGGIHARMTTMWGFAKQNVMELDMTEALESGQDVHLGPAGSIYQR